MGVFEEVSDVLVQSLGVDKEEIKINSNIVNDLGAESIDFLDIVFRLEKQFNLKIEKSQLFPDESIFKNPEFVDTTNRLTPNGIQHLENKYPFLDMSLIIENPTVRNITGAYTVKTIVKYIEKELHQ